MGDITAHFSMAEFATRDGSPIPRNHQKEIIALCRSLLEPARSVWGRAHIASGYRSRDDNVRVGGVAGSFHMDRGRLRGAAADVSFATGSPEEWYRTFDRLGAGGLGLYPTFVHVDNRRVHARW